MKDRKEAQSPKPQVHEKHPAEWRPDLSPNRLQGQNIGLPSEVTGDSDRSAFHLRKAGVELGNVDDEALKLVPVLSPGERLQQGGTYIDLRQQPPVEFTARGDMEAGPGDAIVPKDRVPYEVWNRLIHEEKPGQE